MTRQDLFNQLLNYHSDYLDERNFVLRFLDLLSYPNCFERSLSFGHITASAWVTDQSLKQILLLHHVKLNRWLQPGGHADGNENVLEVAQKELEEETGLIDFSFREKKIFDLDIHTIPERKSVPQHDHYDVRFHIIANNPNEICGNSESLALKWVDLNDVPELTNQEASILRMIEKTRHATIG